MYPARYWIPHIGAMSRLLLLLRPVQLLPHVPFLVMHVARLVAGGMVAWLLGSLLGRIPSAVWRMNDSSLRYLVRLMAWCTMLTDVPPPFSGRASHLHTIRVHHERPDAVHRGRVLFRPFLLQPYVLCALPFTFGAAAWLVLAFPVLLITGRRQAWFASAIEEWLVYTARVAAWAVVLVDEYPPYNGVQPAEVDAWFHEHRVGAHAHGDTNRRQ